MKERAEVKAVYSVLNKFSLDDPGGIAYPAFQVLYWSEKYWLPCILPQVSNEI